MPAYIALLRAVNVMGTGKLPMTELKALCEKLGFKSVRTYIASGNVVFKSSKTEAKVKTMLEAAVAGYTGKPVGVVVRSAAEMAAVLAANPFPERPNHHTLAIFLDEAPPADGLAACSGKVNELVALGVREIYVFYADGVGESKLKIPCAKAGTGRNMNTVARLAAMAGAL